MSSPYPILDNRPIDQWKVTELKEELKRRKLKMTGLKDDLIKRLNEAILIEREALEREANKAVVCEPEPVVKGGDMGAKPNNHVEMTGDTGNPGRNKSEKLDDFVRVVEIVDGPTELGTGSATTIGELVVSEASMETSGMVDKAVIVQIASKVKSSENEEVKSAENDEVKSAENDEVKSAENDEIKTESENSKPPQIDAVPNVSSPNNQVYEVSPVLGFQVESESISSDSVSINEKNELKDNLNADNVNLELEVVKMEMVQPSSQEVPPSDGNLHPLDDQKPCENQDSVEETDDNKSKHVDFCGKNDDAGGGSPVKLNLDQHTANNLVDDGVLENKQIDSNHISNEVEDKIELTEMSFTKDKNPVRDVVLDLYPEEMETSAEKKNSITAPSEESNLQDDSMEEDALETKQTDSNHNSSEVGNKIEMTEVTGSKVGGKVDDVGTDLSSDRTVPPSEKKDNVATLEKRKFQDEGVGINETPKRQRRWNNESLKIPEPQSSNLTPSTTPKDSFHASRLKRNLTRSDSTVSGDAPKERIVPMSPKPPTNSLRIDRFLRPFTLKAVQELLAKTGNVCSFWMDHIKTHCYVTYSSVEEAKETRNALYNLQWPPNGGRLLVAEYVDPQEVKSRVDAPPQSPATPVSAGPSVPAASSPVQTPPSVRQHGLKQQLPPPPPVLQPPPVSKPPTARERIQLPPPPPVPEKVDAPIVTLDDLFRKTKTTPRIYYLPLSDEQVAAKTKK
ncbi:apoptotic chromatin condensation inducer in the nucleus-like isoform X3 [Vitis riparia]|uniref:apoptotic chromatin condensation inducer in the nucleus-like isoform X3 n=1 Tax=Vitis riparia TaxID=96939 RepID=UPI00155A741F|nr:apoptotic chromatin condensation inducer in the nucleus-like isoform X3 [Vitis riparia]